MKTPSLLTTALLATALAAPFALAQTRPAPTPPAAPPAAPEAANVTELPPVNHLVYLDKLPTPAALMKEAAAQGTTIQRIDRTSDSVVVIYKYADGHTDTFGYTTLSAASTVDAPAVVSAPPAPPPQITVVSAPPPTTTVIYREPPTVYYETRYRYYDDPLDHFWAPLALGIGIGWVTGGHGSYYHGHGGYYHRGWRH